MTSCTTNKWRWHLFCVSYNIPFSIHFPIRPVVTGAPWANAHIIVKVTIISSVLCIGTANGSSPVLSADYSYSALMPSLLFNTTLRRARALSSNTIVVGGKFDTLPCGPSPKLSRLMVVASGIPTTDGAATASPPSPSFSSTQPYRPSSPIPPHGHHPPPSPSPPPPPPSES